MRAFKLFFFACLVAGVSAGEVSMKELEARKESVRDMQICSQWLLTNGIQFTHENGGKAVWRHLVDTWAIALQHGEPSLDTKWDIAYFNIFTKGIDYQIQCMQRVAEKEFIYEYWVFNIRGAEWFSKPRAEFYITKVKGKYGIREVVHSSTQFFDSYEIDGVQLKLPVNDLEFLFKLKAWQYPRSYQGHEIADMEIDASKYGYYIVSDSFWGKVGHMFRNVTGPERSRYRKIKKK